MHPLSSPLLLNNRGFIRITGRDRVSFLQGLLTNDVTLLESQPILYTAFLTPQGRFLYDFFVIQEGDSLLLDCLHSRTPEILKKLSLYKLRADVTLTMIEDFPDVVLSEMPLSDKSLKDPRHENAGYRTYGMHFPEALFSEEKYSEFRVTVGLPESNIDLIPEKSIPLECNLDDLHAISWTKGCYIGQQLSAITKYRGEIRKKLFRVSLHGSIGDSLTITCGGKEVGDLRSHTKDAGIAFLRVEDYTAPLLIGTTEIRIIND